MEPSTIVGYTLGIGMRGPIEQQRFMVGDYSIDVAYPTKAQAGTLSLDLPVGLCTEFSVFWSDPTGRDKATLKSESFVRFSIIHKAIDAINQLLSAFKLVRVDHFDGSRIRTIGESDLLYAIRHISGEVAIFERLGLPLYGEQSLLPGKPDDPHGTTRLALEHVGKGSLPTARRFLRCFELIEIGFYSEAVLVGFAILDDEIQALLKEQLTKCGLKEDKLKEMLLRGVTERRLETYLGKLLELLTGNELKNHWKKSEAALKWLNKLRNRIAHQGELVTHVEAKRAVYVSMQALVVLWRKGLCDCEIPINMYRHAKQQAAWTEDAPNWVPKSPVAEEYSYAYE